MVSARKSAGLIGTWSALIAFGGCGSEAPMPDSNGAAGTTAAITIEQPADGSTVEGPDVLVRLAASNLEIVAAGVNQDGSGHHHLIVNSELPPMDGPIPSIEGRFIHLGNGQTEFVLEGLGPGEYQVIALVGDYMHIPLDPPVADTVRFSVAAD